MKLIDRRHINPDQPKDWQGKHLLKCCHSYNSRSRTYYLMYCDVLKQMKDGRLKIKVYGQRYTSTKGEKIRYVESHQVEDADSFNVFKKV